MQRRLAPSILLLISIFWMMRMGLLAEGLQLEFRHPNEVSVEVPTGARTGFSIQESGDLKEWLDLVPGVAFQDAARFALPAGSSRFFRAKPAVVLPPAPPVPTNDVFFPYLAAVPRAASILSDEVRGSVRVTRLRFESFEGDDAGGLQPNEVYAVLARPSAGGTNLPAILVCHGGGGSAEEIMAIGWANRGYVALAPEFPGHAGLTGFKGISRVTRKPYLKDLFNVSGGPRTATAFDSGVAGLLSFNLLAAQPGVDPKRVSITGASFGGYMSLLLSGLLDQKVWRAFSLYGSGDFLRDTAWTVDLLNHPEAERLLWVKNFDPISRIDRVRAATLFYSAANDSYFRPPSVASTYLGIPGEKYLCVSPNDDHYISMPGGGAGIDGTTWTMIEAPFFSGLLADRAARVLPNFGPPIVDGRTIHLDAAALPASYEPWGYCFYHDIASSWLPREWIQLPVTVRNNRISMTIPGDAPICDWMIGVIFSMPDFPGKFTLSTRVYRNTLR